MLEEAKENLAQYFADRLNAGLPLTLTEWKKLSATNREIWEQCYTEYQLKRIALESHYLADTLAGGTLAVETVWDILPEEVQNKYLSKWAVKNAEQSNKPDKQSA